MTTKEWKNPFDTFPNSDLIENVVDEGDEIFYVYHEKAEEWRSKWESDILEAYRLAQIFNELMEQLKKEGFIEDI